MWKYTHQGEPLQFLQFQWPIPRHSHPHYKNVNSRVIVYALIQSELFLMIAHVDNIGKINEVKQHVSLCCSAYYSNK